VTTTDGTITREPPLAFDPTGLAANQIQAVRDAEEAIRTRLRRTVLDVWEIGRRLKEAKAILGHGRYLPWLDAAFGLSESTAKGWVRVVDAFPTREAIGRFLNADVSAVKLLAADGTPAEVRERAAGRIAGGGYLSHGDAKRLIAPVSGGKRAEAAPGRPPGTDGERPDVPRAREVAPEPSKGEPRAAEAEPGAASPNGAVLARAGEVPGVTGPANRHIVPKSDDPAAALLGLVDRLRGDQLVAAAAAIVERFTVAQLDAFDVRYRAISDRIVAPKAEASEAEPEPARGFRERVERLLAGEVKGTLAWVPAGGVEYAVCPREGSRGSLVYSVYRLNGGGEPIPVALSGAPREVQAKVHELRAAAETPARAA
jgi:hypothetical protein